MTQSRLCVRAYLMAPGVGWQLKLPFARRARRHPPQGSCNHWSVPVPCPRKPRWQRDLSECRPAGLRSFAPSIARVGGLSVTVQTTQRNLTHLARYNQRRAKRHPPAPGAHGMRLGNRCCCCTALLSQARPSAHSRPRDLSVRARETFHPRPGPAWPSAVGHGWASAAPCTIQR